MVMTGWTERQLAEASPRTVAALRWRALASMLWSPELAQALYPPKGLTGQAAIDALTTRDAACSVLELLYPKDD